MPSPFPGMNPYLEQDDVWHDFHDSFLPVAREVLSAQVGPAYVVKIDEHLFIHGLGEKGRAVLGRGDVTVAAPATDAAARSATGLLEAPVLVQLPRFDVERQTFLEIRDRRNRQLITVLELINPSNKYAGPDRDQYLAKRDGVLYSRAHFVEIDLLRGGPRLPVLNLPPCDYYALVSRAERRPHAELWPVRLRDPLPAIPIPLREPDEDLRLDLQQVLHRVYDAADYGKYVYDTEPTPALSAEDAEWARQFLPQRGR